MDFGFGFVVVLRGLRGFRGLYIITLILPKFRSSSPHIFLLRVSQVPSLQGELLWEYETSHFYLLARAHVATI